MMAVSIARTGAGYKLIELPAPLREAAELSVEKKR
jgi:hypothetical protein